jgi:UDP-glucose 4-epimerase
MAGATVLVTGIAGGLAHRVAERLVERGDVVVSADYRRIGNLPSSLSGMQTYRASYVKTAIEDVFRKHKFDAVLHLGRVGNLREDVSTRFDMNVYGSQKLSSLCVQHGVKSLVVLSTFHIYGAHPRNHTPISEDDPLHAGTEFPQIADAIQLDSMAANWVYRHPSVRTVVLRPTNVVGPSIHNTISKFLRLPVVPHLMGFNPMVQFVHEDDLTSAVVAACDGEMRGVFNVAGPAVLPWRTALEIVRARTVPLPSTLAALWLSAAGFPRYLVNFYKYPCVVSDEAFRAACSFRSRISIRETLESTVAASR